MNQETATQSFLAGLLWAKSAKRERGQDIPWHPLWCHLLDVAAVGEALLPRFGGVTPLPKSCLPKSWLLFLLALHDIGKADAEFQNKDEEQANRLRAAGIDGPALPEITTKFRHEARSAEWLLTNLQDRWGWGTEAAIVVMQAITGHHGDFQACAYDEEEIVARHAFWPPLRESLAALVAEVLHLEPFALEEFPHASVAGMKLSGLIVLADWIASNPDSYPYHRVLQGLPTDAVPSDYFAAAQAQAAQSVLRLELDAPAPAKWQTTPTFAQVWPACHELRPSQAALQKMCLQGISPGLVIIEAPMGEGKTEGAIYLTQYWGRPGAYIALPTQATSNQMYGRFRKFLADQDPSGPPPRLVHGMAWLLDDKTPLSEPQTEGEVTERDTAREWFQPSKRALLAANGVGTVDQVLMAALNVKHGFLRFLGLTTKTLIVDECHAYDLYMTTLLVTLLQWCRALEVPVILLSATLSRNQKQRLVDAYGGQSTLPASPTDGHDPYPLLTFVPLDGPVTVEPVPRDPHRDQSIQIRRHDGFLADPEKTADLAVHCVRNGGCACVLVNTVRSAQDIYRELSQKKVDGQLPETQIFLFHARFRAERRDEIEGEIIRLFGKGRADDNAPNADRPERAILVATQVVEQSLDVDFDVMLSQIAPIDLLLQRCGRLHRHAKNDHRRAEAGHAHATLHVLLPDADTPYEFGPIQVKKYGKQWRGVYDRLTLLRTLGLLRTYPAFKLPQDFRPLIETCYGSTPALSDIPAELLDAAQDERQERLGRSQNKANEHLIPMPSPAVFTYAQDEDAVQEGEEGERRSYFRAQTREGDDGRAAVVLHDRRLLPYIRKGQQDKDYHPSRRVLKQIFKQKVSLPARWFFGVTAAEGYALITDGPKWLRHHIILGLKDGRWEGCQTTDNKTRHVTIIDDKIMGLEHHLESGAQSPQE